MTHSRRLRALAGGLAAAGTLLALNASPAFAATPFGYVTTRGTNSVTPLSLATNTPGTSIAVGTSPDGLAITPDGTKAYVTDYGSNKVTPITLATNTAGTAISMGTGTEPDAVAFTPDGTKAYVANYGTNTVTPITVATNTPGTAIPCGTNPETIAITPDGSTAYVTNYNGNTVTPINLTTNTAGTPITVGGDPEAIAITPDGTKAYVANYTNNTVTPINLTTKTAGTAIAVGAGPDGVAITPDGTKAYIANYTGNSATPITIATNTPGTAIAVGTGPNGIAVTPDGTKVYVTNYTSNNATPITVATNTPGTTFSMGSNPYQIAITPDQAPVASFTATTATLGSATTFDASASTVAYGTITNYHWVFGDGQTANTATPTTTHTYTSYGTFTALVTETDSAGTSTTKVFTGQTMSRNGGSAASISHTVTVIQPFGWVTPPGDISFSDTLNGLDQTASATLPLDVSSTTTSGWNITATSTIFTAPGGNALATTATSVPSTPTAECDNACTLATTNVTYPYTLPAGTTAPAATKLFNATPGTGDNQTITPTFKLAIPANTRTGTYTSTWTLTLQSGP